MENIYSNKNTYTEPDILNYLTFNQDLSCCAAATGRGFRIYNLSPFKSSFKRDLNGGIKLVAMLNQCNIVALVGNGQNPKFPSNKVVIWDDAKSQVINEITESNEILSIKLKRDKLFVACDIYISIISMVNFRKIEVQETHLNKYGVFAVNDYPWKDIIGYPDKKKGYLTIKNLDNKAKISFRTNQSGIACLQMSYDGSLIASASEKGTLIRIYDNYGNLQQELRRGGENALIYSIAFDINNKYIACSSDRNTVHIFFLNIKTINGNNQRTLIGKVSSFFGITNEYLISERSFAQMRLNAAKSPICAFGPNERIYVISKDGNFIQGKFNPQIQGECEIEVLENMTI